MTDEPNDDWTAEDDRLVLVGRIADMIETMPIADLERVLIFVKGVRADELKDLDLEKAPPASH